MQCPIDGEQLVMTDRAGVEIDYCPKCRGVWLDRGELDKIIEQSAPRGGGSGGGRDRGYAPEPREYKRKKRGGFLEELFDF
jgi:Zn-finger nucleic acid-binding protein